MQRTIHYKVLFSCMPTGSSVRREIARRSQSLENYMSVDNHSKLCKFCRRLSHHKDSDTGSTGRLKSRSLSQYEADEVFWFHEAKFRSEVRVHPERGSKIDTPSQKR